MTSAIVHVQKRNEFYASPWSRAISPNRESRAGMLTMVGATFVNYLQVYRCIECSAAWSKIDAIRVYIISEYLVRTNFFVTKRWFIDPGSKRYKKLSTLKKILADSKEKQRVRVKMCSMRFMRVTLYERFSIL